MPEKFNPNLLDCELALRIVAKDTAANANYDMRTKLQSAENVNDSLNSLVECGMRQFIDKDGASVPRCIWEDSCKQLFQESVTVVAVS